MTTPGRAVASVLEDAVGDDLETVAEITSHEADLVYGEERFAEVVAETEVRSPEEMHRDAVHRIEQAALASDLYGNDVHAELQVTEHGTGLYLFVGDTEGVVAWLGPDADLAVPAVVEECRAAIGETD